MNFRPFEYRPNNGGDYQRLNTSPYGFNRNPFLGQYNGLDNKYYASPALVDPAGRRFRPPLTPQLPLQYRNTDNLNANRNHMDKMALSSTITPQGVESKEQYLQRQKNLGTLIGNYSKGVEEGFKNVSASTDITGLRSELGTHGFSPTIQGKIREMLGTLNEKSLLRKGDKRTFVIIPILQKHLDDLQRIVPTNQGQQVYIEKLQQSIQRLMSTDSYTLGTSELRRQQSMSRHELATKEFLKMGSYGIGIILGGLALISGSMDFKNKTVSWPTLMYTGVAASIFKPDIYKGKFYHETKQISFLQSRGYEALAQKYDIQGHDWASMSRKFQQGNVRKLVKNLKDGGITREEFLSKIANDPKNEAHKKLLSMNTREIAMLEDYFNRAKSTQAKNTLNQYIASGTRPSSLEGLSSSGDEPSLWEIAKGLNRGTLQS